MSRDSIQALPRFPARRSPADEDARSAGAPPTCPANPRRCDGKGPGRPMVLMLCPARTRVCRLADSSPRSRGGTRHVSPSGALWLWWLATVQGSRLSSRGRWSLGTHSPRGACPDGARPRLRLCWLFATRAGTPRVRSSALCHFFRSASSRTRGSFDAALSEDRRTGGGDGE